MNEYRKVFKMVDNEEIEIKFSEIKNGMKIKLYEPDGTLVKYKKNNIFTAMSDCYKGEDEILTFNAEGYSCLAFDVFKKIKNFIKNKGIKL